MFSCPIFVVKLNGPAGDEQGVIYREQGLAAGREEFFFYLHPKAPAGQQVKAVYPLLRRGVEDFQHGAGVGARAGLHLPGLAGQISGYGQQLVPEGLERLAGLRIPQGDMPDILVALDADQLRVHYPAGGRLATVVPPQLFYHFFQQRGLFFSGRGQVLGLEGHAAAVPDVDGDVIADGLYHHAEALVQNVPYGRKGLEFISHKVPSIGDTPCGKVCPRPYFPQRQALGTHLAARYVPGQRA